MNHSLERTSPKGPGMPFIGTCRQCGRTNLPVTAVLEECDNPRGLTPEESILEAIKGPQEINHESEQDRT